MEAYRLIQMLPQSRRLKKENDISRVFKMGKTFKDTSLSLKVVENRMKGSRFGFIVPLKVAKKATSRNRIKRRMSEIVRLKLPRIKKGFDVLLSTFPGTGNLSFPELEGALDRLFQKANLYD